MLRRELQQMNRSVWVNNSILVDLHFLYHPYLKFSLPFLSSLPFVFFSGLLVLPKTSLALIFIMALFAASATLLASSNRITSQANSIRKLNLSSTKTVIIGVP